jgi:hypothetical protein
MNSIPPKRVRTPTQGWHDVATGEIGGKGLLWHPGYAMLEAAESAIQRLEHLPAAGIDWQSLLHDLQRFKHLPDILRRHSFSFDAWDEIEDFSVHKGGVDEEGNPAKWADPWESDWVYGWLSMDHSNKRRIFRDFEILTKRIRGYPPLAHSR